MNTLIEGSMDVILAVFDKHWLPITFTILLIFFMVYYSYVTWNYDYWKKQGVAGESTWPIIGTMKLTYLFKRFEMIDQERHKKFGRVCGGFEGRVPVLYIIDPELIKQVMVKDFPTFTNRRFFDITKDPILGKMVSLLRGEEWKITRAILTPTFTTGKLKQMVYLIQECIKMLIKSMEKMAEENKPTDMKSYFSTFTLDVIASCAFGMKTNSLENPDNDFVVNARKALQAPSFVYYLVAIFPQLFPILRALTVYSSGNPFQFFKEIVNKMIDMRIEKKSKSRKDFLDLLIEAEQLENMDEKNEAAHSTIKRKKILTRDAMTANCMIFLLGGHESTAATLASFVFCIATNPQVQDTLIQEIDDAMSENEGKLTYETVMGLQYLDMSLSETMRLYPPAIRVDRACDIDGYKLQNVTLKKETVLVTSIYALHYDEEFYPNPGVFDPQRFSRENKKTRNSYTYMPFGVGPRNCLAMRFALTVLKLTIAHLLSQFRFTACDETEFVADGPVTISPKKVTLLIQKRIDQHCFDDE